MSPKAEDERGAFTRRSGDVIVTGGAEAVAASTSTSSSAPRPQQPPAPAAAAALSSTSASSPVDEVDRILRVQHNAYAVLKLDRRAKPTADDIKKAHRALSRLVHPDKNPGNPRAADASAALNSAVDVLSDPVKRKIFDLYVQDTEAQSGDDSGEGGAGTGKSFADWEAETMRPPRWLLRVLGCPGGGVLVVVLAVLLLIPALVLLLVVALLCLPLRLALWHCCGVGEPIFSSVRRGSREREGEEREGGGGGGAPSPPAPPPPRDVELGERTGTKKGGAGEGRGERGGDIELGTAK